MTNPSLPLLAATLCLLSLQTTAYSDPIRFDAGIVFVDGGLAIENNSNTRPISAVTLNFGPTLLNPTNDTFFDTSPTPPGVSSAGFTIFVNNGIDTINLPSNMATDGSQVATFTFNGFDPGDSTIIRFDLDQFDNIDGDGDPLGGKISVLFSSGDVLESFFLDNPKQIAGADTRFTADATGVSTVVPEAAGLPMWLVCFVVLITATLWCSCRRKRRVSTSIPASSN